MESSPAQLIMTAPSLKHAPACSTQEMLELLGLWGDEAVQAQLPVVATYEQITLGMGEKGYTRDMQRCCVKIKELRQQYQKAGNSCSGAALQTCHFYKQ